MSAPIDNRTTCRAESPANGMASTIFELAKNPAVQARMVEEIDKLGLKTAPSYEDLPKLSYVEAVFQVRSLSDACSQPESRLPSWEIFFFLTLFS